MGRINKFITRRMVLCAKFPNYFTYNRDKAKRESSFSGLRAMLCSSFITYLQKSKIKQRQMNEGGKFLKKLWCCVDGRV